MSEIEQRQAGQAQVGQAQISLGDVLGELRANFEALGALLDQLAEDDLAQRLAPQEWSVAEILLHLIHAERWLQPQLLELRRAVAPASAVPSIGGVTLPDTESKLSVAELRWAGTAVREDTVRLIDGLDRRQLREPANISLDGSPDGSGGVEVIDLSLRTMALTIADHQLFHLRQIERTLGRVHSPVIPAPERESRGPQE